MQNSKFNFATVFAVMVLLVFSYITFLGLSYWQGGNLLLPVLLTVALIVVVGACVFMMCMAKATRWRRLSIIGQTLFGLVVLAVLLLAALPFTNFVNVAKSSDEITAKITETCDAAEQLDNAYKEYVDERISDYEQNLGVISSAKNVKPSQYKECLGGASGSDDSDKIENLSKSLRSKLLPDGTEKAVRERHQWLDKAKHTSVWNPLAPANINKIGEQVEGWVDNYKKLSDVTYKGEEAEEFTYSDFDSQLSELTQSYRKFHAPSPLAVIISLVCFGVMMLPYFLTEKSLAGATSKGREEKDYE